MPLRYVNKLRPRSTVYDSEELWEFEEVDVDDWKPPEDGRMGLAVDFGGDEIKTLTRAFGAPVEMFQIMHDALMERAHEAMRERRELDSDAVAAAD